MEKTEVELLRDAHKDLLREKWSMMVEVVTLREENRVLKEDKEILQKAVSSLHRRIDVLKKMLKWRKETNG